MEIATTDAAPTSGEMTTQQAFIFPESIFLAELEEQEQVYKNLDFLLAQSADNNLDILPPRLGTPMNTIHLWDCSYYPDPQEFLDSFPIPGLPPTLATCGPKWDDLNFAPVGIPRVDINFMSSTPKTKYKFCRIQDIFENESKGPNPLSCLLPSLRNELRFLGSRIHNTKISMPIIRSPGCCTFVLKMNILETVLGLFEVTVTAAYPDEPPVIKFQRCNWSEDDLNSLRSSLGRHPWDYFNRVRDVVVRYLGKCMQIYKADKAKKEKEQPIGELLETVDKIIEEETNFVNNAAPETTPTFEN